MPDARHRQPLLQRRLPGAVLLAVLAAGVSSLPALLPRVAAAAQGSRGAIEGRITLSSTAQARSLDRYTSDTGESREIQQVPVVVYIEGTVPDSPPARPSGTTALVQRGQAFSATALVVPLGTQVSFPNGDPIFHNVFSYSRAKRFDLGRYRQGEAKTVVFDRPGYVKVMCEVHKWMRTAVVVVENPYYAVVAESGQFRIDGVPPGHYRLAIEHFDRRTSVEVDVPAGGVARADARL
ncbi:MAG: carboxypeptidase regulatory-like domain-containing protein [Vicinamibacterales bacterium]